MDLEHWETYYRSGALATCPTGPAGGYDLEARDAWTGFFTGLPEGASILDVGTGNGAVALIARETAAELKCNWKIHATDLAQIDPPRHVPGGEQLLEGIQFHAGVATEHLPFQADQFDAVSGHYALEYMDIAAALAQIHRVLKPGGGAQFIIHHSDSLLVRSASISLREAEIVLRDTKIYRRLRKLVAMDKVSAAATEHAAAELRNAIRTLRASVQQVRPSGGGRVLLVTLDAVQKLLSARTKMRPEVVDREVGRAEDELRASVRRLNDLVTHARTAQQMADLERQAVALDFTVVERVAQHHAGTNLVGWRLLLRADPTGEAA